MERQGTATDKPDKQATVHVKTRVDRPVGDANLSPRPLPLIVAVIPALNEALSISRVVERLRGPGTLALRRVVVVDNGSTDGTGELARRAGASVVREERRGYGYALAWPAYRPPRRRT